MTTKPAKTFPPLADGSLMPFGRWRGRKAMEVPLTYWRWWLAPEQSEMAAQCPGITSYARERLAGETAQRRLGLKAAHAAVSQVERVRQKSDPAKAGAALEEFKKFRQHLSQS